MTTLASKHADRLAPIHLTMRLDKKKTMSIVQECLGKTQLAEKL
jgi:hypothetical protein